MPLHYADRRTIQICSLQYIADNFNIIWIPLSQTTLVEAKIFRLSWQLSRAHLPFNAISEMSNRKGWLCIERLPLSPRGSISNTKVILPLIIKILYRWQYGIDTLMRKTIKRISAHMIEVFKVVYILFYIFYITFNLNVYLMISVSSYNLGL